MEIAEQLFWAGNCETLLHFPVLSDGIFISHQKTIVNSFYCTVYVILFKIMHKLLNFGSITVGRIYDRDLLWNCEEQ